MSDNPLVVVDLPITRSRGKQSVSRCAAIALGLALVVVDLPITRSRGKHSVPIRSCVGSAFDTMMSEFRRDPTLPRIGTDCLAHLSQSHSRYKHSILISPPSTRRTT